MDKKEIKVLMVFFLMLLIGAFVGWMYGFDFSHRNYELGTFTTLWLICSVLVAGNLYNG